MITEVMICENIAYIVNTSKSKEKEKILNLDLLHNIDNLNDLRSQIFFFYLFTISIVYYKRILRHITKVT